MVSELAVTGIGSSDTVVLDAVVTWSVESMTQPTCPSTGGFSL